MLNNRDRLQANQISKKIRGRVLAFFLVFLPIYLAPTRVLEVLPQVSTLG